MKNVLFVCTGNIFRSLSAEYILRKTLGENSGYIVSSAGTSAKPAPDHMVHTPLHTRLAELGLDVSAHKQRKVSPEILAANDIVIAMSTDHQTFLHDNFSTKSHLFYEASYNETRPFPDLWEEVPDYDTNHDAAIIYIRKTVDLIRDAAPHLIKRLPLLS